MTLAQQFRQVFRETWALVKRRPYLLWWPVLLAARIVLPPRKYPEWWRGDGDTR